MLTMKETILILISFFTLTALIGCEDAPPDPVAIKNINAQEGYKLIEENKNNPNFVILDVRTPEEFNAGHIKNAVNIDYKNPDFKENVDKLDKSKTYALYCHSGRRAVASSDIMADLDDMSASSIGHTGGGQQHTNVQPYLVINWCIALVGIFPSIS